MSDDATRDADDLEVIRFASRIIEAHNEMVSRHQAEVATLRKALIDAVSACTGGPALSEEHWSEIHALAGRTP